MKHVLLLVQGPEDVAALPAAAKVIHKLSTPATWVVYSPVVAIDSKAAQDEFDKEIAALKDAEEKAAILGDYDAAKGYKASREGKMLEKGKAVRDAWSGLTKETFEAREDQVFKPFIEAANPERKRWLRITRSPEHYDSSQWFEMLNGVRAQMPAMFRPGDFAIMWPSQLAGLGSGVITAGAPARSAAADQIQNFNEPPAPKETSAKVTRHASREEELQHMRHFGVVAIAKKLGIDPKLKKREQIVAEILAAEKQQQAA